jgi:RNA polymerase sigma-70 factor (ECF subfamily)
VAEIHNDRLPDHIIARARTGVRSAFEEIVRRYQRRIRAWLAAHCPPGGDVDEVAQRTFLAVYTRLGEYRDGTNFDAWLFTIARFQLMTEVTALRRQADYHSRFASDLLARELERRAEQPDGLTADRLRHLASCLECVPERDRQVLDWRYRENLPVQEMAARSGRSAAAVKKLLWLLRVKIRDCIDAKLAAEGGLT